MKSRGLRCRGRRGRGPITRRLSGNGYIMLAQTIFGVEHKMLEHRLIMEIYLGRQLRRDEHVHHKNERIRDNRIENLEVLTNREHMIRHLTPARLALAAAALARTNGCAVSSAIARAKTHCRRGHTLSDAIITKRGTRTCRSCKRARDRVQYLKRKERANVCQ